MRHSFLLSLLPFAILSLSCGETKPYKGAPIMELSGSLLINKASSYHDLITKNEAETLFNEAKLGLSSFVFFGRSGCSHCKNIESSVVSALNETKLNIHFFYYDDSSLEERETFLKNVNAFRNCYETESIAAQVPSLYLLKDNEMTLMDMYEDTSNSIKFASYLNYNAASSSFYRFNDLDELKEAKNLKARKIIYDSSDPSSREAYVKEFNKNYATLTYVLDYYSLTLDKKEEALTYFGLPSYQYKIIS